MVATQPSDVLACGSGQEHFGRVLHEPVDLPTPLDGTVPTGLPSSIRCCMMLSERSLGFGMASGVAALAAKICFVAFIVLFIASLVRGRGRTRV